MNLNKVIRKPTTNCGMLDNGKKVTSNITQLSLGESLEKWLGRQVSSSFSWIQSSILAMKELHLRWNCATFGSLFAWGPLKYLLNFHAEEHFPILWKFVYMFPVTHQEFVMSHSCPLHIDCIRSSFFFSISITVSSNGRFPRSLSSRPTWLRRCWYVYCHILPVIYMN